MRLHPTGTQGASLVASALALAVAALAAGCQAPCRDIAARRHALADRTARAAAPHGRLHLPAARVDRIVAASLTEQPVEIDIAPDLPAGLPLRLPALRAHVREVRLAPARPGRVGFAIRIDVRDARRDIVTLVARAEVAPRFVRGRDSTALEIGLSADSLRSLEPLLGPHALGRVTDALAAWLPDAVRRRVPRPLLERSARELVRHLTRAAYAALRASLLARLGEVMRLRLGLPDLPIERLAVRSTGSPVDALEVDLHTDLPVRRGLSADRAQRPRPGDHIEHIQLRLSGSAVAEIGNWAIERGHLPRRYTRNLVPRPDGDYRPVFDWRAGHRRPLAIHIFQERGGCSYFAVGLRPELSLAGHSLVATVRDREIEAARGSVGLELGVRLKSLVSTAADTSRHIAAATHLEAGGRRFAARVTRAELAGDELALDLDITPARPSGP